MKRLAFLPVVIVMALGLAHLAAQDYKKKGKDKPKDEAQDSLTTTTGNNAQDTYQLIKDSSVDTHYFLFPEFYSFWPVDNNDTILKYECFDIGHYPIIADTVSNANDIQYITVTKTYNDYLKTYIDAEGKPRPQPIGRTISTFERTGNETWKSTDVASNYSVSLQEHKNDIVRRDTTIVTDPVTGSRQLTIRQYYRVTEIEGSEVANAPAANKENGQAEILYYTVPEFYFHWPKKSRDTTYVFECYDERDTLIPDVANYDTVRYFSLLKKFIDSTHSYRDDDGKEKPLPTSLIVKRYDHSGNDKWISIEYPGNKFTELRAFKDVIVNVDTESVLDPVTGHEQMRIFRHYKVIKN